MVGVRKAVSLRGQLQRDVSMANYTSWRVGGLAQYLYRPADAEDLLTFLHSLPENEPLFWLGLGSNLLIREGGLLGTVIVTAKALSRIKRRSKTVIWVEAGVPCAKLAKFCAREGLKGAEFLAGIPGTVGGALAMNAGAFGSEIWDLVTAVEVATIRGDRHQRVPQEYQVGYREVHSPRQEWFLAAELCFMTGDREVAQSQIRELLRYRSNSQPIQQPCAGSVFRNPLNNKAGRLIESCGLKGATIGGAQVSEKHANFIINKGSASATDIECLIQWVAETVRQEKGVTLVPEVHIAGLPA
ncbi:UDP-N-acetylenolpyruvoylglucosamine reductase [Candidatus Nitrosoglobus terrae]|uniref:UDP-N-acetylenolpyruvoylglucosamine reductase n=1 Tax=Candidatus Nitrosoglobus terrae TaxID=1630141 RepID=A0A1Q2SKE9_9GAMM|nr:UDP-N-acetylmuramate dehydrogenase [Candidatus Nitrosoglobus terrae]BAW79598.1 UDP-N-acetylenolpyruvoylglucosamine reductase [Candidatus Nitrosoglobus terrae]